MSILRKRSPAEIAAIVVNRPEIIEFVPDDEVELVCAALGLDVDGEVAKLREMCEREAQQRLSRA